MAKVRKRRWKTPSGEIKTAWVVDYFDQNGVRQRAQFATKRRADDHRVEIEGKLRQGTYRSDALKITVGEISEDFLLYCEGRKKRKERMTEKMYRVYEGHIKNYICPDPARHEGKKRPSRLTRFAPSHGLTETKVGALTPGGCGAFRDRLRDAGVSVVTTRKILSTLQCILKYAVGQDIIAVNVAEDVEVIGRRDEGAKKITPPPIEGMKALLDVAPVDFKVHLLVASSTAMRAGEFHALRWRHFDFEAREVRVETRVDAYGNEDTTKTAAGIRVIPIGRAVIAALKKWRLKSEFKKPDDLVFPNRRGTYEDHDNMVKRDFTPLFDKLAERHALDPKHYPKVERFNWHALRHFGISMWIAADLRPKTVQTFAGHSSLQVTMDRYGHLFKDDDHRRAMDDIARGLIS